MGQTGRVLPLPTLGVTLQGPHLGLPQMIQSRAQFGYRGVILVLLVVREQVLALVALALLGAATAVTGWFTSFSGLLVMTLLSSIGFHYFETVNQSLQLQWVEKKRAPQVLGWIVGIILWLAMIALFVVAGWVS